MFVRRRPGLGDLEQLARQQQRAQLTYDGVGKTLDGDTPAGYRFEAFERLIGRANDFDRARAALADWQPHRGSGIEVWADGEVAKGTTMAFAAPLPLGFAVGTCRIVAVIDDEDRYGFAYGTLPIHPESGEELFVVERRSDDVWFRIAVFSRPHELPVRLAAPVARVLQARATGKYLDAMMLR